MNGMKTPPNVSSSSPGKACPDKSGSGKTCSGKTCSGKTPPIRDSVAELVVLEQTQGIALFRPAGIMSLSTAAGLIETAIRQAAGRCDGLMVSIMAVSGFGAPSIPARHEIMRKWAQACGGRLRLALVMPPELMDPDRYGESAAANLGLIGKGFLDEAEALTWLRAP